MNSKTVNTVDCDQQASAEELRKTSQFLLPATLDHIGKAQDEYNIYPAFALGTGQIFSGYDSIANWIKVQKTVVIDGYAGVFWDRIKDELNSRLLIAGLTINWIETTAYFKPATAIDTLIKPFLGTADAVWGTKCTLTLKDLFQERELTAIQPDQQADINILIGPGAVLSGWNVPVIYFDLPKNELQFRMRAGSVTNLGAAGTDSPFAMYKRFYFVDWVLLNQHKKEILHKITLIADAQWPYRINWMFMNDLKAGLDKMSRSVVRVRPWFEPGIWGGQWIKQHIKGLNNEVVNYAWSFEMIVPENGLLFESDSLLLEVSFDFLMFYSNSNILGKHASVFGDEFPIRFDFLDTVQGGDLSIQCHPRLQYIREQFGENITQDETYYILDCEKNAKVYLGFQENIQPETFRKALENSQAESKKLNIEDYVQAHHAKKHDLFLIPNGTVHSAGAGNLVLEISATPYIFTFKMYDWVRLDLEGKPRPINIDHAFKNLDFERKGKRVQEELIAKQLVISKGKDWELIHLPTHQEHFYDVHRIEFDTDISISTDDCCIVMMLVEGQALLLETQDGTRQTFAYAETFMVPAAAGIYTLTNLGKGRAKVIKAFLK
ncbi:class I mannose-6-phosphate isomerase [Pedobacter sp. L105]|uniref:class I mannose-6-phosphate isomerase n=1 Tax=Pedobacter sp. L105 TaxID=1641871 RepID=UPI00131AD0EF|nr:class I mannose-6-phosphate isomerase [Pedobacter sp. L105]